MRFTKSLILTALGLSVFAGCQRAPQPNYTENVVVERPQVPEGTEKYCWQEPKVVNEKNGPGLDEQGHWYHPPYTAVREVKMGRWVPCNEAVN
jgi:hypothetical protein